MKNHSQHSPTSKASLEDIVFRKRNKAYGAYQLRRVWHRNTGIAFLITVGISALLLLVPVVAKLFSTAAPSEFKSIDDDIMINPLPPAPEEPEEEPVPEAPAPPPPPARDQIRFVEPEVGEPDPMKPEDSELEKIDSTDALISHFTHEADGEDGPPTIEFPEGDGDGEAIRELRIEPKDDLPKEDDFTFMEKNPAPVNMDQVKSKMDYPAMARESGIEGRVILRVLLDENGRYMKHVVKQSPHKWLTEEAIKHVDEIRFTPGIQAGNPVKCWITVPFDFRIH